ncbi:DMT family transporter [Amycolatopsis acididurans]|uniref:DMT family transporter n=1 Tax=Amycolatopsis acididurans TaxID=2724524 RepID=UPI001B325C75|nr:DMT family transporter [Amycolatopsis acididurans]
MRNIVMAACGMVLVGGSVGVSHALTGAPLFTAQGVRYAAAFLILLALARFSRVRILLPRGREWLWLTGVALSGLVLFNVAVVRGVAHAEPAVIAVAVACTPVLLGVLGPVLERRTPRGRIVLAAVVVTVGGVLVEGTGRTDAAGVGWAVLALACEAGFTLLAVPVLERHGPWGVSVHSVWIAAVVLLALGFATEGPTAAAGLTAAEWGAIAYLAVMVTAVAFLLWYTAVASLGAGRVGLLTGIAPISAALTGTALTGTAPGPLVWLGMAAVIAGLAGGLGTRSSEHRNLAGADGDVDTVSDPEQEGTPCITSPRSAATATAAAPSSTSTTRRPRRSASSSPTTSASGSR